MRIFLCVFVLASTLGLSRPTHAASVCDAGAQLELDAFGDSVSPNHDPNLQNKLIGDMSKCERGDVVMIPTDLAYLLAKYCDFSKSVISVPQTDQQNPYSAFTLCVVGEPKGDD
jgi:hypothetical protein